MTLTGVGLYLLWASVFIRHHLPEGTSFFRAFDARHWARVNVLAFVVGPSLAVLAALMYVEGARFWSGLVVAPAGLLVLIAVGRATGGISRL